MGGCDEGVIVWYSVDGRKRQQAFTFSQLRLFGYDVRVQQNVAFVTHAKSRWIVDSWPIDPTGAVTRDTQVAVSGQRV